MSHAIETYGDKAAVFSARETPWHRLGTVTEDCLTAEDAIRTAHLDYEVTKQPLQSVVVTDDGVSTIDVPDKFATVRTNPFTGQLEALGVVGPAYRVIQTSEYAAFLDALVEESGAHFETGGSLNGGRQTFLSLRAPKGMMIGGHDAVDLFIVGTNTFDGSSAFTVAATPIRPVCKNTLTAGLAAATARVSIRHTTNAMSAVEQAQAALGIMWNYMTEFDGLANHLYDDKITRAEFDRIVQAAFPEPKGDESKRSQTLRMERIGKVTDLYSNADTQDGIRGTKWGAYNALTEWADWFMPVRGDENARAERIANGGIVADFKARALALVTA